MSKESIEHLNTQTLCGFTDLLGLPWHYDADAQGDEPNIYPMAVPIDDVRRRLFHWKAVEGAVKTEYTVLNEDGVETIEIIDPDRKTIIRPDTKAILGIFKTGYQIHDFDEWLLKTVAAIIDDELNIGSAGLLKGGAVAWVSIEIPESITTPEGVVFRPKLLACTSHDGSLATTFQRVVTNVVCHAKGTPAIDGNWRGNVEDHPSATCGYIRDGFEVTVKGLPFSERVSEEHRYWARQRNRVLTPKKREALSQSGGTATIAPPRIGVDVEADWVEAHDLIPDAHEIGTPIDTRVMPAPDFHDPELLWLIGLWWGDGHLNRKAGSVTLAVANDQPEIMERIKAIAPRHSVAVHVGCSQITFYDRALCTFLEGWYDTVGKTPPAFFETLPLDLQRALVQGYYTADGNRDTTEGCILVSIGLNGLLALRRILSRLGIPASIRKGSDPSCRNVIMGRTVNAKHQWTIRFWRNVDQLGYSTRFTGERRSHPYIEDGFLWSRVESVDPIVDEFWPITTNDHTYLTAFGCSHNCDNTMSAALGESKDQRIKIKHSRYSNVKLNDARNALAIVHTVAENFAAEVAALCDMTVTPGQWEAFMDEIVPLPETEGRGLTMAENKRAEYARLWAHDDRVAPWKNTAWGVVQAVNTYVTHCGIVRGCDRHERNMEKAVNGGWDALDKNTLKTLVSVL